MLHDCLKTTVFAPDCLCRLGYLRLPSILLAAPYDGRWYLLPSLPALTLPMSMSICRFLLCHVSLIHRCRICEHGALGPMIGKLLFAMKTGNDYCPCT
ncbi:hypothetical protein KCU66_g64, partial [Aureobasidium melanogenum]